MEVLKIDESDVILDDKGNGRGKVTISGPDKMNFSYEWGAMNSSLRDFLLGINQHYFVKNMSDYDDQVFDGKLSVRNVRRYIKEEMSYELPWYEHMDDQKELRKELKSIERCDSEYEFVDRMQSLSSSLCHCDAYFLDIVKALESEPWHFIGKKDSYRTMFIGKMFQKLQKKLK